MPDDRVWTAVELERRTADERRRLLNQRVVTDLSELAPEFLARVRAADRVLLEERGAIPPQGGGG